MHLYRIAHKTFIDDLTGQGAKLYGGRWNTAGNAMIYSSFTIELAMLESLTHTTFSSLIKNFGIISFEVSDKIPVNEISINDLPKNWRTFPAPILLGKIGDQWLNGKTTLLMKVPSVLFPTSFNCLINPNHPDFRIIKVSEKTDINIDIRLSENLKK
jgi:RES domain-containing protein